MYLLARLSFLLLLMSVVNGQELAQMQITGKPEKSATEFVGSNIRDVNGRICAGIQVISNISGLQYDAYNGVVKVTQRPGLDMVFLQPDERVLEVYKAGFAPLKIILSEYGIRLEERAVWVIRVSGEQKEKWIPVSIVVDPPDATVIIDGETKLEGKTIRLMPGTHKLIIQKDMYEPQSKTIEVSDENVLFEFTLKKSEPAFLVITSEPGGAEVFLNGELKGTTPFQMRVASGEYKMELKKALYESASKLLKIKGGQTVEEKIRLIPNFGFIRITSTPSEASIEIDGKYVGNAPFTSSGLTAGEHKIALRKNLYHTHEAVVTIRQDQTLPYQATLKPAYGTLRVNSEPPGITCYLDGREIGRTPIVREQLASGRYTLRLAGDPSDMLREVIEHIVIRDGETTEQKITMPKDYGTLKIEVDSDVTIVINGDIAGAGSITRMLKAGSHRIEARKNKYNPDRRDVSIAVGETKTVRLNPSGRFGQLSVMVNPPDARDARISINGKDVGSAPKIISNLLEGTHRVEIKKEGYLPFSTAVEIKYDKMVEINPRLITYAGSRLQIRNRWKWRAVFTGLGTAACAGATLYSQKLADAAYENYGKSLYMAEAARFKKDTNQFDTYTKIGAGATGTFAVWTFYNWIRMASIRVDKNPTIRINYRILPAETIVQLSVAF